MASRARYIPTLDGWRAIAILLVIVGHGVEWSGTALSPIARLLHLPNFSEWVTAFGDKGVEVFFCLSGFLITSLLVDEFADRGRISVSAFYVRRVCRIFPPSLVYLAFISVLSIAGLISVSKSEVIACIVFLRNYLPHGEHWYTGHFWSLSVEEHFYLLWPGLIALVGFKRARWYPILAICAVVVWRAMNADLMTTPFKYRTDVRIDAIMLGALAALMFPVIRKVFTGRGWQLLAAAAVLYIGSEVAISAAPSIGRLGREIAVLSALMVGVNNPGILFAKALEVNWLRYVGRISYSLYLWQEFFFKPPRQSWIEAPFRLVMPFICAALSYKFVEKPLIKVGHRLSTAILERNSPPSATLALKPNEP